MTRLLWMGVLAGCGGDQADLDKAHERWLSEGSDHYNFTVTKTCLCPDVAPVSVEVLGNGVIGASTAAGELEATAYQSWFTVEGVFAEVQAAIDGDAHDIRAVYDGTFGYPITVEIDWEQLTSEDAVSFAIADMVIDPDA